ncbi:hypothetical protein CHUAL_005756 [Chamberlinius hualienensis]
MPLPPKKTRFRFSEQERIQVFDVLYASISEGINTSEEDLWINIHAQLCHDNPRFEACSCRLLKEHTLDQVRKFKKYDSEEATEAEVERLSTAWGQKLRTLMTAWAGYEALVEYELSHKVINKGGRPRKILISDIKTDAQLGPEITEEAVTYESLSQNEDNVQISDAEEMETENVANHHAYSRLHSPEPMKPNPTIRKRKGCNSEFLEYLMERNRLKERKLELDERRFTEEAELNRRKMILEEMKVDILLKEREANIEREKVTTKVLLMILDNPSVKKKINGINLD